MKREFFINAVFLVSINLLIKPFYIFGIDRTVQNTVGSETYGIYAALLSLAYLMQIINDFGIQNYNNRNIAMHHHLVSKYFPHIVVLKCCLGLVYTVLVFGVGWFLGYDGFRFSILSFLVLNQVLVSLIFYLRSNISGLQMFRKDSIISALDKFLMIVICSVLLWSPMFADSFRIEWFVYAQTVSFGLTAIVALVLLSPHLEHIRFRLDFTYMRMILKKSYPYALVIFLMSIYTRIDQVMIERLLPDGPEETGIYAAAYRLLDASNMIGFLFAGLLLPMFSRMIKLGEAVSDLVWFSFKLILTGTLLVSAFCFFFRDEIMALLYVEADAYWGSILGCLMFSFIAVGTSYIFGTLLTASGNLKALNIISFIGVLVNVILNIVLIAKYKAFGAAAATLFTQSALAVAQIIIVSRTFDLKAKTKHIIGVLVYAAGTFFIMYACSVYLPLNWMISLIIGTSLCSLLAIFTRMVEVKTIKGFLKTG
ncbi:MAG: oligosaccharide flippase family protein [Bacteroidota bacterium]